MKGRLYLNTNLEPIFFDTLLPSQRREGLSPVLVDTSAIPQNNDKVFVYSKLARGIWVYKTPPCSMPYWGNSKLCYKIIVNTKDIPNHIVDGIIRGEIIEGNDIEF